MRDRVRYAALWLGCSALLLCAGFLAVVALALRMEAHRPSDSPQSLAAIFGVYASVVLVKGMLPALVLALALWAWLDRDGALSRRGAGVRALAIGAAATLTSVAAAAVLLPLPIPGLPPVRFTGVGHFARTCVELAAPVALAAWLPSAVLPRIRRHHALVLAGLFVVFLAGGASMTRFARPAPAAIAPEPAPEETASEFATGSDAGATHALSLQLLAASVGETPDRSVALIADAAGALPQLVRERHEFARHPGVRIAAIASAEVLLDNQGEIERLDLSPGAFYAQLGLRDGDRVEAIDGAAVASPDASGSILRALADSPQVDLSVLRSGGASEHLVVPRERVFEETGARAESP